MNWLSLRNNQLKFETLRKLTHHFRGMWKTYLKSIKENLNMLPVGLETLGLFTKYAQKSPFTHMPFSLLCVTITCLWQWTIFDRKDTTKTYVVIKLDCVFKMCLIQLGDNCSPIIFASSLLSPITFAPHVRFWNDKLVIGLNDYI
jgi:hypothetical protein